MTNSLLVRILLQNTTFNGVDPLKPISNISTSAVQAQSILLASLSLTLFVAFVAVLGKQWILYYTRATTWGNVTNRGKERQTKLVGLQKWRLELVMEFLPVVLQLALLLFAVALIVYLWDLDALIAGVVLGVTLFGTAFYLCIAILATVYSDCPFQTPISVRLQDVALRMKELAALARVRLRQKISLLRPKVNTPNHPGEDTPDDNIPVTLSNPKLWRSSPLFARPALEDVAASAGFWLLENSTSSSAASAVTAVFSKLQWPSSHPTETALVRLRDVYLKCVQAPDFNESTYLKALQSATAYYILYHTQFIWDALNRLKGGAGKLSPSLPPDLFGLHNDKWRGDDVFEHLLRIKDRSQPFMSGQFLAHIAPYWVCGDSDGAMMFRPKRLQILPKLIKVLEESDMLNPTTLTDCILSVGVAVNFPLHPDDLIRIDKRCVSFPYLSISGLIGDSDYLVQTFETVVEHIHGLAVVRGHRHHAKKALEILITLAKKATLPLVDATWIRKLLDKATRKNMGDDIFTLFLRFNAERNEEGVMVDVEIPPGKDHANNPTDPEYALFIKILQNVRARITQGCGWEDEAVYGGLIAIRDIPRLGSFPPDNDFLGGLFEAMERGNPFRIKKAAYDIIAVAREGWLGTPGSHKTFRGFDFPRRLHAIVIEIGRSEYQQSFLRMIEILSYDEDWHPYLREAMEIWLSFRREGQAEVLRIIARIGGLQPPEHNGFNHRFDEFLETLVANEWARVPARPVEDLTPDRLEPFVEVTLQLKGIVFTEDGRRAVIDALGDAIPLLENRPGLRGDIPDIVKTLREILRAGTNTTPVGTVQA